MIGTKKRLRLLVFLRYVGYQNGGVQRIVDSYYSRFDREKFEIEYLVLTHEEPAHEEGMRAQGAVIHSLRGVQERNLWMLVSSCKQFFAAHHRYDILHCHQTNFDFIPLYWAKRYGIPVRIIHSHSTGYNIRRSQFLCEKYLSRLWATHFMAASEASGAFLFGKHAMRRGKCTVVTSAIDLSAYFFNPKIRKEMRRRLALPEDGAAFCHIARISPEKRQEVTLRAFREICERLPKSRLFFVGSGKEYETHIKAMAQRFSLSDRVAFLGMRGDVAKLLQAFDVFMLPSQFEGLPVALIEALASGIVCIISDTVGCAIPEAPGIFRVPSDAPIAVWADGMLRCADAPRQNHTKALRDAGYSIEEQTRRLEHCYERICGGGYDQTHR